jgi:hypothetical protein
MQNADSVGMPLEISSFENMEGFLIGIRSLIEQGDGDVALRILEENKCGIVERLSFDDESQDLAALRCDFAEILQLLGLNEEDFLDECLE